MTFEEQRRWIQEQLAKPNDIDMDDAQADKAREHA